MSQLTLGKYELLDLLGEGATSEVYRARDKALGREVALKVLKPSLVADGSAFERFVKEAQAASGLFHPNIATVLDMDTADGRYFIAMRYFPGQSLDKILKSGPLSWPDTARLARQIGAALDYAHGQGFLHRDVKPGNILRAEDGNFILTDFGLTRAMAGSGLTSHTGVVLGTPAYIAPEIWNGQPATPATDQYALACVLCESLTGQTLFAGDTPAAVMTRHVLKGPELPAAWPEGVPAGVTDVLRRALAQNPAERYPNMNAFTPAQTGLKGRGASKVANTQPRPRPTVNAPRTSDVPQGNGNSNVTPEQENIQYIISALVDFPWERLYVAVKSILFPKTTPALAGNQPNSRKTIISWNNVAWIAIICLVDWVIVAIFSSLISSSVILEIGLVIGAVISAIVTGKALLRERTISNMPITRGALGWVLGLTVGGVIGLIIGLIIGLMFGLESAPLIGGDALAIFLSTGGAIGVAIGGEIGGSVTVSKSRQEQKKRMLKQGRYR
jgi:serine/threonine protein kinase